MPGSLNESTLFRLTGEAIVSFLRQAPALEVSMHAGCCLVLCNEPVADLNYVVAGRGAGESEHFANACRSCISRNQPFLAIVFPEAGDRVAKIAADLGLVYAVDFPIMVRNDAPLEPSGNESVVVRPTSGAEGSDGNARVLSSAFCMPQDIVRRVMPPSVMDSPAVSFFLATIDEVPVGAVTVTHHGDTSGIWAMGTDIERQRGGVGRRLLSTAMAEARKDGARRFFLGATPAGQRLYESLGYSTRLVAKVWVSGETHQA